MSPLSGSCFGCRHAVWPVCVPIPPCGTCSYAGANTGVFIPASECVGPCEAGCYQVSSLVISTVTRACLSSLSSVASPQQANVSDADRKQPLCECTWPLGTQAPVLAPVPQLGGGLCTAEPLVRVWTTPLDMCQQS